MSLYLLHIEPRYKHAGHYLGFCESDHVDRRVNQHLAAGSKASPLVCKRVTNHGVDSGPEGAVTCELLKAGA